MTNRINDLLFERRRLVGENLFKIIKSQGHTKISFSKIAEISRPTLNKLINGLIDNKTTFLTHITKISKSLGISLDEFLDYNFKIKDENLVLLSDNSPENHKLDPKARETFDILDSILDLCEIYY